LTAPLLGVGKLFGASVFDAHGVYQFGREVRLNRWIAPLLMATLVAMIFLTSQLVLETRWSLLVAASAAFGTQIWSTASRGLWSHTWGILLVWIAIHLLVRGERERCSVHPVLLGSALAWAFFCRPTFAIPFALVAAHLAMERRSELRWYLVASCFWIACFVSFSHHHYDTWLPAYYDPMQRLGQARFAEALVGNLVSPSRGLFVYTPLVAVCSFLVVRFRRTLENRSLVILALLIITAHWLVISTYPHWWGGWSYGSRLTTDLVPWFVLLGILGLRGRQVAAEKGERSLHPHAARAAAAALLLASLLINANGGLWSRAFLWNASPEIDAHPERLWDWRHPQFLYPFISNE